jgi:hypothetical protein
MDLGKYDKMVADLFRWLRRVASGWLSWTMQWNLGFRMNKESRNSCTTVSSSADVLDLIMKKRKYPYHATPRRDQIVESWTTRQSYDLIHQDHTLRNCSQFYVRYRMLLPVIGGLLLSYFLEELVIYMPTLILSVLHVSVKQVRNMKM